MSRTLLATGLFVAVGSAAAAVGSPADEVMTFKVRVANVSTPSTLKLSNGTTAPAPNSPVLWFVHTKKAPLFRTGEHDFGKGLEALAEDGNPSMLVKALRGEKGISSVGAVDTAVGADGPGPLLPGGVFEFTITASRGDRLTIASMFGQSNDLFYAPREEGIGLFDASGKPVEGDVTDRILLWDAGTEVNQEPGLGPDQGPRQPKPNTGEDEHGAVRLVSDGFKYPRTSDVLRVTISCGN
jgi:hypothetical protein